MKSATIALLFLGLAVCQASPAQPPAPSPDAASAPTPAERKIDAANRQLAANPKKVQAFSELVAAYLLRYRETANSRYLTEADGALQRGLALTPEPDFQLQRAQVALLLAQHRYSEARRQAAVLNHRTPDDVLVWGYLAEAEIALGDYPAAETFVQWMLNMRPNNIPGLVLGAKLRVLFGDPSGAIQFLNLAYAETSPTEVEEQAWIANQVAEIDLDQGKIDRAEPILERAGQIFPGYPATLENLARVKMAQHRPNEAAALLTRATQTGDRPHTLFLLARAEEAAGSQEEARATDAAWERLAAQPDNRDDRAACDLILRLSGEPSSAAHALALARERIGTRSDIWTLDAFAWALYANGSLPDAEAAIQKAMAVGIQSAQIFAHAGAIAERLGHAQDAAKYRDLAGKLTPSPLAAPSAVPLAVPLAESGETVAAASSAPSTSENSPARPNLPAPPALDRPSASPAFAAVPKDLLVPRPTDTERLIHKAQTMVAANPSDAGAYAALGADYLQKARETGDVSDYQLAEESLLKSLDLAPEDFSAADALRAMAEVCMGEHRFTEALAYAEKALAVGAGDVSPFALVGDAYADMGDYAKAAQAYARLTPPEMTLSPRAAYARDSRLSYLKFIAGDTQEAIRMMKLAVAEGVEAQLPSENLAWLYYELGEYLTQAGNAAADQAYLDALNAHPGDYRALAAMARLRANHGQYAQAIDLYRAAIAVVPMPTFVSELGDLYAMSGNQAEAQKQYRLVEYIGKLGRINRVLHNRDLALYYADHDTHLKEALELANRELDVRRDVYTWDALAWALYKNGQYAEASKASENALRQGTRDSLLFYHAGAIAARAGARDAARADLKMALRINPHFHLAYANSAERELTLLDTQAETHEGNVKPAR